MINGKVQNYFIKCCRKRQVALKKAVKEAVMLCKNNETKENKELLEKAIVTQDAENRVMQSGLKKFKSDCFLKSLQKQSREKDNFYAVLFKSLT